MIVHGVAAPLLIHLCLCRGTFGLSVLLGYGEQAAMNMAVRLSESLPAGIFEIISRGEIPRSYDKSTFYFFGGTTTLFSTEAHGGLLTTQASLERCVVYFVCIRSFPYVLDPKDYLQCAHEMGSFITACSQMRRIAQMDTSLSRKVWTQFRSA